MNWSESSCSVCSTRSSSSLAITRMVLGVTAVVVPIRTVWPAMHPSPKKSLGPNIATTASFPDPFTTEYFTPPFWTYMTVSAPSPCEKIDSPLRNSVTFLATPAVSRNTCGSKESPFPFFLSLRCFIFTSNLHLDPGVQRPHSPYQKGSRKTVQKRTVGTLEGLDNRARD